MAGAGHARPRGRGSEVRIAVNTLGQVQQVTGEHVELAYDDQGYTGATAQEAAAGHGIRLGAVRHAGVKRGLVLLPWHSVVVRNFTITGKSSQQVLLSPANHCAA